MKLIIKKKVHPYLRINEINWNYVDKTSNCLYKDLPEPIHIAKNSMKSICTLLSNYMSNGYTIGKF